jgi:hypothetical protein
MFFVRPAISKLEKTQYYHDNIDVLGPFCDPRKNQKHENIIMIIIECMRDYTFYDNDIRSSEGLIVMVKVYEAKHDDDIVFFY